MRATNSRLPSSSGLRRIVAALAVATAAPAPAQEVVIKLATIAPQGSSWHRILQEMGETWAEASGARVKLRIYAGGSQGGEGDMILKMNVGQLHAAAITSAGMHDIAAEPAVFSVPGLIDGSAEYHAVLPRVAGRLEAALHRRGYTVLTWVGIGAAYAFCTRAYRAPVEMAEARFFAWNGDPTAEEGFRSIGLRPVILSSTDLVASLQTGMVNCVVQPPAYALTARTFDRASHMMAYPWSWLVGAIVVRKQAWEGVPADARARLAQLARDAGARLDAESQRLESEALTVMHRQGLDIVQVDPAPWRAAMQNVWPVVRGKAIPADLFDDVVRARDEVRAMER